MPVLNKFQLFNQIKHIYIHKSMSKQGHQPERFDEFKQLKDGSGFTIKGSEHIFKYDKYGGWFDQHGNYYDRDGNPEDPPSDQPYSEDSRSSDKSDYDQYQKEFGRPQDYDEDEEDVVHSRHLEKVAANIITLNAYPRNQPLRVHFKGMNYYGKREQIFNYFKSKVTGIINLICYNNQNGKFNGKGYFVVQGIHAGQELVGLQGEKYLDREVNFELDDVEEFLLTPLQPKELSCDFGKGSKKYVKKDEAIKLGSPIKTEQKPKVEQKPEVEEKPKVEEKSKVEEKPTVEEKKQAYPKFEVKVEQKKENLDDFATYTFLKKAFPKKSSFKDWLTEKQFTQKDYKTVQKITGNEDYAKISMKKKVYHALNNSIYNGEKIVFKPQ